MDALECMKQMEIIAAMPVNIDVKRRLRERLYAQDPDFDSSSCRALCYSCKLVSVFRLKQFTRELPLTLAALQPVFCSLLLLNFKLKVGKFTCEFNGEQNIALLLFSHLDPDVFQVRARRNRAFKLCCLEVNASGTL